MTGDGSAVQQAVGLLRAGVDALLELDLSACSRDELLELAAGTETQRRRVPASRLNRPDGGRRRRGPG